MNTYDKQEERARRQVSGSAILKVGLGLGLYLFIFSGGAPWLGAGVANGILGRSFAIPWPATVLAHFGLCLLYVGIIGAAVYRLHVWVAAGVGLCIGAALYFITFPILATHNAGDGRALAAHLVLGLFGSVLYKAISVPKIA